MVAEKLGVIRQSVSKWENSISEPSTKNLLGLSSLFNVEVDSLIKSDERNLEIDLLEIKTTKTYYYNEVRTKIISYIALLCYLPLNIYFYNSGIYGEIFIDLGLFEKLFFRDLLYDIPYIIIMIGMLFKFIKDIKDTSKKNVLITKKDKIINYISFLYYL